MLEVMVAFAATVLLAVVLWPRLSRPYQGASRLSCVSNLKQITLSFRMWANDQAGHFPFTVASTNDGGSMDWIESGEVWRHFVVMTQELNTPKVLLCPNDRQRSRATTWQQFDSNARLSYVVGFDASELRPLSILTGDRNLRAPIDPQTRIVQLTTNSVITWTSQTHERIGNLGFGDGSVAQLTSAGLRKSVAFATPPSGQAIRIAVP
jgi:hypothetical protein